MSILTRHSVSVLSGLALALGFGAAAGHTQEPAPQAQVQEPAAAQVDDGKLRSFAVAFLEVARVNQVYQSQIEAAQDPDEQRRLQQAAGAEMIEAVDAQQGITVDEYNTIIEQAQADPQLAQRINGHITEAAKQKQ